MKNSLLYIETADEEEDDLWDRNPYNLHKSKENQQRLKELNVRSMNDVFDIHVKIALDRRFIVKFLTHVEKFLRKDENHIAFFGGNLIGVYPIKWTIDDKLTLIEDILQIDDYDLLVTDIYDLPDINKNFHVSSDAINLVLLWLAHKALTSKTLTDKEKILLAEASINMLQYKFLTSIHSRYFKFSSNISIAMEVYEQLDNKSQLKRHGSWKGLVQARTQDILHEDSLHTNTIRKFDNDIANVKMINDIWNRLKSIFNILTDDFYRIKDTQARIITNNPFTMVEGEAILKDSINRYAHIKSNMHAIVPDRNAFIREDMIQVIITSNSSVYPQYLKASLEYMSNNYLQPHSKVDIMTTIDEILEFTFRIIRREKIALDNIGAIAIKLRGALRASRLQMHEYDIIKEKVNEIVELANHRITDVNINSTRIAVILYVSLIALIKR